MLGPSQIAQAVILIPQIGRSCRWPRALTSLGQVSVKFGGVNHQLSDTSFDGKMWKNVGLLVCPLKMPGFRNDRVILREVELLLCQLHDSSALSLDLGRFMFESQHTKPCDDCWWSWTSYDIWFQHFTQEMIGQWTVLRSTRRVGFFSYRLFVSWGLWRFERLGLVDLVLGFLYDPRVLITDIYIYPW